MAERPVSRTAAVVIVFVWIASIALTGWLFGSLELKLSARLPGEGASDLANLSQ
jgi:hypothetical protein